MDQEDMIDLLDFTEDWTREQREKIVREESVEQQAEKLKNTLLGLARVPQDLVAEEVEYCEDYVAGADVWRVGSEAYRIELYSNDTDQIELARSIRLTCRQALIAEEYCIFVHQVLPLIQQIAEGAELPPLTPPKPRAADV